MYYDVLLVGALLCGLFGIYAVSRWLSHEYKLQAIADEINNLPLVDPYMEPAARFAQAPQQVPAASTLRGPTGKASVPNAGDSGASFNAPISLGAFQQHAPLRLVGGDDLTHAYRFSKRVH